MKDEEKTKEQRINELTEMRRLADWYRNLYENNPLMIFSLDSKGIILSANKLGTEQLGYTVEELVGRSVLNILHPDDRETVLQQLARCLQNPSEVTHYELRKVCKDGSIMPVREFARPLIGPDGNPIIIVICEDITERKKAEERLCRFDWMLRIITKCNQALVRAKSESELLKEICRIIVDSGVYLLAWVGFAEHDEKKTVRPVAQYGYEEGYLETVNITWADTERGRGPTGTAIQTGRPVICKDILTDPKFEPWRAEALKRGYASSIAIPLIIDEEVIGTLNIYAPEPDAFNEEEVRLLTDLAEDLAYGIKSLRTLAEHKKMEEELRNRVKELESFYNMAVNRELKMNELKKEIRRLSEELEKHRKE